MPKRSFTVVLACGALLALSACAGAQGPGATGPWKTLVPIPMASPSTTPSAATNTVTVALGETDPMHMFIHLSQVTATAGEVTFVITNEGTRKHEFVVLATDTLAADFPIASFEGETDRFNEDTAGTNVGETGDMEPGATKTMVIALTAGHYAVVCNLPGHYRMGMHQDFTVT